MSIQIEKLSKAYGNHAVLTSLTLTLPFGGHYAILGPSGVGKTTLLRILCGLEAADSGALHYPSPMQFSFAFQEARLFPQYTVRENIDLISPENDPADVLASLDLADAASLYPHELSGGMQIRAGLARALSRQADIYLLDEITAGQDAQHARMVTDALCRFTAGKTRFLVSHDVDTVLATSETAILLGDVRESPLLSLHGLTRDTLSALLAR